MRKAQANMTKSELDTHIVCAVSIFLVAYVGVLLAYYFRELEMFSVLNIFAGGLMFSAGIIHLLPDAAEKLEDQSLWAFISFSSAFLFLFLLEKTLHQQHETHKVNYSFLKRIWPEWLWVGLLVHWAKSTTKSITKIAAICDNNAYKT